MPECPSLPSLGSVCKEHCCAEITTIDFVHERVTAHYGDRTSPFAGSHSASSRLAWGRALVWFA
jgi:hypothetical protein